MITRPKVSVVIPAYNAEEWIARSVESVLRQTIDDWELIVVDDGSQDGTQEVVQKYGDDRIILTSQPNGGPSSARNRGMAMASGEYIAFLDADDEYAPSFLQRTTSFLDQHSTCCACSTNAIWVRRNGDTFARDKPGQIISGAEGIVADFLKVRMKNRSFPQIYLVLRAEWLEELGPFDPDVQVGEEEELLLRWIVKGPLGYINEPLAYYYDNPGSFIKDLKRSTHAKAVLWGKVIPRDDELQVLLPSYRKFRDLRLFRSAVISVAAGCLDDAKRIANLWPASPSSLHWWIGHTLVSLPRPLLWLLHKSVGRTKAVKNRNEGF